MNITNDIYILLQRIYKLLQDNNQELRAIRGELEKLNAKK